MIKSKLHRLLCLSKKHRREAGLLLLILALTIINGCYSYIGNEYIKQDSEAGEISLKSVFPVSEKSQLYKTKIWVLKNYFSGLMAVKNTEKNTVRTIFMNETGIRLFDFEFGDSLEDGMVVHFCVEPLNKKAFINMFKSDFQLLIQPEVNCKTNTYISNEAVCLKTVKGKNKYYYYCNSDYRIDSVKTAGLLFKDRSILIDNYNNQIPQHIEIKHERINIKMKFDYIKR
jgi:hypothetical protein